MNQLNLNLILILALTTISVCPPQSVFAQQDPRAAAANQELLKMRSMTAEQFKAQDAMKKKIYYCVKSITKGQAIRPDQIEGRDVLTAPADCLFPNMPIVGKQTVVDVQIGQIISQRDFGIALSASQNAALLARNYSGSKLPMGSIVFNKVALAKGAVITSDQLGEAPMPMSTIPQDAMSSASLAAGRKAKYDKAKLQILMQHEIQ